MRTRWALLLLCCLASVQLKSTAGVECDLARSCGTGGDRCNDKMSAYEQNVQMPKVLDRSRSGGCVASAGQGRNWWYVDFGMPVRVRTVRMTLDFADTDGLEVWVAENPTFSSRIPANAILCYRQVDTIIDDTDVLEITCDKDVVGTHLFIQHGQERDLSVTPSGEKVLRLCDVEVFNYTCLGEDDDLSCPPGSEPAPESCTACRGCVPCGKGYFSDEDGLDACEKCPGTVDLDSPEGAKSIFECNADVSDSADLLLLDGSSHLSILASTFDQTIDSWVLEVNYILAPRTKVATFYLSRGGDDVVTELFTPTNFPCRNDGSMPDGSMPLSNTLCCLQDVLADYVLPVTFRGFADGLDLVAANDRCDGAAGSEMIRPGRWVPLVPENGTVFVDANGQRFEQDIRLVPLNDGSPGKAQIIIPDAVLYHVSQEGTGATSTNDVRDLFVGLLEMNPTGTVVLASAHQQVPVEVTRAPYAAVSLNSAQNIDYTFLSFLNARVHRVKKDDQAEEYAHYAAVSFVHDGTLLPVDGQVVDTATVVVEAGSSTMSPCDRIADSAAFEEIAAGTWIFKDDNAWAEKANRLGCGPSLDFGRVDDAGVTVWCPEVIVDETDFVQIYIPLVVDPAGSLPGSVTIKFNVKVQDAENNVVSLPVEMVVVTDEFVTWCADTPEEIADLASKVSPSLLIGTATAAPPRTVPKAVPSSPLSLEPNAASTLQDALVSVVLEIDGTPAESEGLGVFVEDLLVIHVNPGADVTPLELTDTLKPTYSYHPETRDASLYVPAALKSKCPAEPETPSFFGCVHKHVIKDKKVEMPGDAYVVGSAQGGGQEFMGQLLAGSTSDEAARKLGRELETWFVDAEGAGPANPKKTAVWVSPGHVWGSGVRGAQTTLSQDVIVYTLFGVDAGVDEAGTRRRRHLLVETDEGGSSVVVGLRFDPPPPTVAPEVAVREESRWEVRLGLDATEACLGKVSLRYLLESRIEGLVRPHASAMERVEVHAVRVEGAECDGARRTEGEGAVAVADTTVRLLEADKAGVQPYIDWDAVKAGSAGALLEVGELSVVPGGDKNGQEPGGGGGGVDGGDKESPKGGDGGDGVPVVMIAAAAGGGVLLCLLGLVLHRRCRGGSGGQLKEVLVGEGVPKAVEEEPMDKLEIEGMLFGGEDGRAATARSTASVTSRTSKASRASRASRRTPSPEPGPPLFGQRAATAGPVDLEAILHRSHTVSGQREVLRPPTEVPGLRPTRSFDRPSTVSGGGRQKSVPLEILQEPRGASRSRSSAGSREELSKATTSSTLHTTDGFSRDRTMTRPMTGHRGSVDGVTMDELAEFPRRPSNNSLTGSVRSARSARSGRSHASLFDPSV